MAIEEVLQKLKTDKTLGKNIQAWRILPSCAARFAEFPGKIHPELRTALQKEGMDRLYVHQRQAADLALDKVDVVAATPTASGKTLCYNLPVFQSLLEDQAATALYLFPTKALSQDQVAALHRLNESLSRPLKAMTYDGDTPAEVRKVIREAGDIVVTNPYMLHVGIMPNHARWLRFFKGLSYVVVDEMHTLTGVFGSHFANLMRRLLRICAHYGSQPTFIFSSATLANPAELASELIGRPVKAVTEDGSPRGEKHFIFYNPPVVNAELGIRRSGLEEARRLASLFSSARVQTLTFCRTRNSVEVMVKYLRDHFERNGIDISRIKGYRGGYLPLLRRQIEKGLREGEIDAVVATNALELGIDIGSLDVCILTGYPGSVASTLQQAGRSGRKAGPSAAILVGRSHATDQFVIHHPDYVLDQAPEAGAIDPDNLIIRVNQMKCAAFELPFEEGEAFGAARETAEILDYLEREAKILRKVKNRWYWMSRAFPAEGVSLHAGDMDNFVVFDEGEGTVIGEVDRASAMSMIHTGAIYGHQGQQYLFADLDYEKRRARAAKVDSDYYTEADVETRIQVHHLDRSDAHGPYEVHLGEVSVARSATLFKKIRFYTRENLGTGPINLPSETMHTEAFFLALQRSTAERAGLFDGGRTSAFLGFGTLFHRVAPLYVRCDGADLGVTVEIQSSHFSQPVVTLFDNLPGGVGLAETAARLHRQLFQAMADILKRCACPNGCPCCIDPPPEGEVEHKAGVAQLLAILMEEGAGEAQQGERKGKDASWI
jgi:DEAD/DEAH box helicase domain-containing protein